jgi:cobaltochelatase CobT
VAAHSSGHAVPQPLVEAVGACTRALAGDGAPASVAESGAATLSGLRADGDRLAVQRRYHRETVHAQHRPPDPVAADLFDGLELARLDALGTAWLPGVAGNLLAHPGLEPDGLRWLAFELLSGRDAPGEKNLMVAVLRASMTGRLLDGLTALSAYRHDQDRFAEAAAAWVVEAAPHLPRVEARKTGKQVLLPSREIELRRRAERGDPGATRAPLRSDPDDDSSREAGGASSAGEVVSGKGSTYRVYTTAHDRVVQAAALASREELIELRQRLEADLQSVRAIVARLAKRLLRVLMARQTREWRFDLDEGLLDASRLAPLIASRGGVRPFKQEQESPFPSTVVTLLIDHSGSMRGRPMLIAALTVEIFARVLERCGVRCEILGFTTREWNGGEPGREWARNNYPEHPGRLNALEHIVIKSADMPWRRARLGLGLFLRDDMLKENIDGEAVAWAHARLMARSEKRRVLVVVSDGTPMDEATLTANGHDYLDHHLATVVEDIERRSPVQLAAIGIGHNVSRFYRNAMTIARIEHLGPALSFKLISLLSADVG